MTESENIFTFENVSFGYHSSSGDNILIRDFSGAFLKGEFIAVIGRNGSGKSTVLKSLVRLLPVIKGNIYLKEKPADQYSLSDHAKLVSFVSTILPLSTGMTVYELVSLGRIPHTRWLGTLTREDHLKVMEAIEATDLKNLLNKQIGRVSDGERQRAMIARTLAQDTPVIVLDEPTAFLDLPNRYELAGLLSKLTAMGKTVIMSTHDTEIALRFPDKLLIINNNFLTCGAPEDHIINGGFKELFQFAGFRFNQLTAEIELVRISNKLISVIANDKLLSAWTKKALKRAGFGVVENDRTDISIQIRKQETDLYWKFNCKKTSISFSNLYDVIKYLKTNFYQDESG